MTSTMKSSTERFSTRDILTLATLACMGAVMSVVVGQIGAALRAIVGMPGLTQGLAGLHVLWLALAALLVPRCGAATATGLIKGTIEMLLGSPHGLLVLLVSAVAGLLIDGVLWLIPYGRKAWGVCVGAGLAAGSNVVLFQLVVRLPRDGIVVMMLVGLTVLATLSGVLLGGTLALSLIQPLRRAGLVHRTLLDRSP